MRSNCCDEFILLKDKGLVCGKCLNICQKKEYEKTIYINYEFNSKSTSKELETE